MRFRVDILAIINKSHELLFRNQTSEIFTMVYNKVATNIDI